MTFARLVAVKLLRPFLRDLDGCKAELLALAKAGGPRPASGKHPLGRRLIAYTCSGSTSFDVDFSKTIRRLTPHWFVSPATVKKEKMLALARAGSARPKPTTKLWQAFKRYTWRYGLTYDAAFTAKMHTLALHWFAPVVATVKEDLLRLARAGAPRPSSGTELNAFLKRYTQPSNISYDIRFSRKIRKLAPHWFPAFDMKMELLALAKKHAPKPERKTKQYRALWRYANPASKYYDAHFAVKMRCLAPHWFQRRERRNTK
jgi:hypothetical protein